jgi:hypothetical protein
MTLLLDNKRLQYDRAFTHNDIQYPANWLRLSSLDEKQAIGITEVVDDVNAYYDQRFYWGVDNPKEHEDLKADWIAKTKDTANKLLSQTDWYITRKSEKSIDIPQEITDCRDEIRAFCNIKVDAINATTDTNDLATYCTSSDFSTWQSNFSNELEVTSN